MIRNVPFFNSGMCLEPPFWIWAGGGAGRLPPRCEALELFFLCAGFLEDEAPDDREGAGAGAAADDADCVYVRLPEFLPTVFWYGRDCPADVAALLVDRGAGAFIKNNCKRIARHHALFSTRINIHLQTRYTDEPWHTGGDERKNRLLERKVMDYPNCAARETRTLTPLRVHAPEACVSTIPPSRPYCLPTYSMIMSA